jgi:hypothetical protein
MENLPLNTDTELINQLILSHESGNVNNQKGLMNHYARCLFAYTRLHRRLALGSGEIPTVKCRPSSSDANGNGPFQEKTSANIPFGVKNPICLLIFREKCGIIQGNEHSHKIYT